MISLRREAALCVAFGTMAAALLGCSAADSNSAEVPDPCTLLSASAAIAPILGTDPGAPELEAAEPHVRKLCLYSSGLFLSVERQENYEQAVREIGEPSTGATSQELTGVGNEAMLSDYGDGVFQVVARGDEYYVGVTGMITAQQATSLASRMLDALDVG